MNQDIKGLRDIVATLTQTANLNQVVKENVATINKDDCGCKARQKAMSQVSTNEGKK